MPKVAQAAPIGGRNIIKGQTLSSASTATSISKALHSTVTSVTSGVVPESWDDDLEEGEIRETQDRLAPLPAMRTGRPLSSMTHNTIKTHVAPNSRLAQLRGQRSQINYENTTLAGSVADLKGKGKTDTTWRNYKLGDVVRVIHITPNNDRTAKLDDPTVSFNEITGASQHKFRPGVVVGIFEHCLKILPMYSSQGNGLSRKPAGIRDDCVMIFPAGIPHSNGASNFQGSPHESIEANMKVKDGSYIHFSQEYPVNYASPIQRIGDMDKRTTKYVLSRYQMSLDKGLMMVEDHASWQKEKLTSLKGKLMLRQSQSRTVDGDGFQQIPSNKRSRVY